MVLPIEAVRVSNQVQLTYVLAELQLELLALLLWDVCLGVVLHLGSADHFAQVQSHLMTFVLVAMLV